jgi:hypothetical protein
MHGAEKTGHSSELVGRLVKHAVSKGMQPKDVFKDFSNGNGGIDFLPGFVNFS